MERLIEKNKLKISPGFMVKGEGHPLINMEADFLKTVDLENIHMRIACGRVDEEPKVEMKEFIISMPTELKKKFVRD